MREFRTDRGEAASVSHVGNKSNEMGCYRNARVFTYDSVPVLVRHRSGGVGERTAVCKGAARGIGNPWGYTKHSDQ